MKVATFSVVVRGTGGAGAGGAGTGGTGTGAGTGGVIESSQTLKYNENYSFCFDGLKLFAVSWAPWPPTEIERFVGKKLKATINQYLNIIKAIIAASDITYCY